MKIYVSSRAFTLIKYFFIFWSTLFVAAGIISEGISIVWSSWPLFVILIVVAFSLTLISDVWIEGDVLHCRNLIRAVPIHAENVLDATYVAFLPIVKLSLDSSAGPSASVYFIPRKSSKEMSGCEPSGSEAFRKVGEFCGWRHRE